MKEQGRTYLRRNLIILAVISMCFLINMSLSSASDSLKDDVNKTSGLVIAPMDADDNANVLTSTKTVSGVKTQLLDKNGKDMGTPTIGLNNRIIYTGLSWGEKYTLKILSVPNGYFIVNHSYKADPKSYEVEVTDKGWVLVDNLNGNSTFPNGTFPGVNDKGGKTPFKLYLGTVPESKKSVSKDSNPTNEYGKTLTASAGETITYTIDTTINNAANYGYVFYTVANLHIKYTSYDIEDQLDNRLSFVDLDAQMKNDEQTEYASIPKDNYTVSYDASSNKVVFSLTKKGIESLYKAYDVFNPGKSNNSYLRLTIRAKVNEDSTGTILNTSTTYINKVSKKSNTVKVSVPWTKVNVKKVWKGKIPQDNKIEISLLQNGKVIRTAALDGKTDKYEAEPWHCTFDSLPTFDKDGNKYIYEIKETMPAELENKYSTKIEKSDIDNTNNEVADFEEINFLVENEENPMDTPPSVTPPSDEHSNPPAPPSDDKDGNKTNKVPETGDSSQQYLYFISVFVSLALLICFTMIKKYK